MSREGYLNYELNLMMLIPPIPIQRLLSRDHILIVIRHGETDWNANKRFQGQKDIPLNRNGKRQAERVARELKRYPLEAIVSSDLSRAADTAQCIANYYPKISIHSHRGLREIGHGESWEGRTEEDIYQSDPLNMWRWKNKPTQAIKPGGESLDQAFFRVTSAFDDIRADVLDRSNTSCPIIALVGHEGVNRLIICHALGLTLEEHFHTFILPNCAIAVLEFVAGKQHAHFHGSTLNFGVFSGIA